MAENADVNGPARSGNKNGFSRRRLLGASGVLGLTALGAVGCQDGGQGKSGQGKGDVQSNSSGLKQEAAPGGSAARVEAPPPENVLGANFNGDPGALKFKELEDISATWLRGFFPMYEADKPGKLAEKAQVKTLLEAHERGYGTILSLKFQYIDKDIPTPGSPAMKKELERLDRLLPIVMKKMDILVIGNEPFLETSEGQRRDPGVINVFYEKIAQHVIAYRDKSKSETKLYMGALNHLHRKGTKSPATDRWMDFVKETRAIDGVDIHPHLAAPEQDQDYLEYILPKLRSDQKFLVTEFSLVLFWKDQMEKKVSAKFGEEHKEEKGKLARVVLEESLRKPFSQKKWDDFLSMSPWFNSHRNYLQNQVERFRKTGKLAVATYGVVQDDAMKDGFGKGKNPWMLNSLFCPYTVEPGKDGLPGRNRAWITGFRAVQNN